MRTVVAVVGAVAALAGCAPAGCPAIGFTHPSRVSFPAGPEVATVVLRLCQSGTCRTVSAEPEGGVASPAFGSTRAGEFREDTGEVTVRLLTAAGGEVLRATGDVPVHIASAGAGSCAQHVAHVDVTVPAAGTVSGK